MMQRRVLYTFGRESLAMFKSNLAIIGASDSRPKVRRFCGRQDCGAGMSIAAQRPGSHAASNEFDSSLTVVNEHMFLTVKLTVKCSAS